MRLHNVGGVPHPLYGFYFKFDIIKALLGNTSTLYTREKGQALLWIKIKRLLRSNIPTFLEIHKFDYFTTPESETKKRKKMRKRDAFLLNNADGIIFISESLRQMAKEYTPFDTPSTVAHSGFNPDLFYPRDRPIGNTFTFGYTGKLTASKGVDILLKALALTPPNVRLKLVGNKSPGFMDYCRDLFGENVNSKLIIADAVPYTQIPDALADVDAVALPYVTPYLYLSPIKLFEALGMGLPIVAMPLPQLTEVLTPDVNAVFAQDKTAEAFAGAMTRLASEPGKSRAMGQANSGLSQEYTWDKRAQRIIEFMRQIA
jgi:glycosyltransferase involved in cell wall biosynthesis